MPEATTNARLKKHDERLDKHDRQIKGIHKLIQDGMRYVVDTRKDLRIEAGMLKRQAELQAREPMASWKRSLTLCGAAVTGSTKRRVDLA